MSYSVYMKSGSFLEDVGDYTSNMGRYFYWALSADGKGGPIGANEASEGILNHQGGLRALSDRPAVNAKAILDRAIIRTETADIQFLEIFNSSNDWGSWPNALQFLKDIRAACVEHPDGSVWVQ